jgi:hypothetical protein
MSRFCSWREGVCERLVWVMCRRFFGVEWVLSMRESYFLVFFYSILCRRKRMRDMICRKILRRQLPN